MTIYKILAGDENFKSLVLCQKKSDWNEYYFDGKSQENWSPVAFKWHEAQQAHDDKEIPDFALVHDAGLNLAVNEKTKLIMESFLGSDSQYLPITVEDSSEPWYLVNIIHTNTAALDLEHCEFRVMRRGQIGALKSAVFNENAIEDNRAFVYPQSSDSFMFKGDALKNLCKKHNLKGLGFFPMKSTTPHLI